MFDRPPHATRHCRHYSYITPFNAPNSGPNCAVGCDLTEPGASRVCMPDPNGACDKREEYTDEERAAWIAAREASTKRLVNAITALPRAIPLRTGGYVACPNCAGRLRYDRWERGASIQCSTENCCGARFNIAAGKDWPQ